MAVSFYTERAAFGTVEFPVFSGNLVMSQHSFFFLICRIHSRLTATFFSVLPAHFLGKTSLREVPRTLAQPPKLLPHLR